LNGGFDWRFESVASVGLAFDQAIRRSGRRSLRLYFDGSTNTDFQHLRQRLPVRPNTSYRFQCYLRAENLSSDSGVRFRLYDEQDPSRLDRLTEDVRGNQEWKVIQDEFTTGPETRLLVVAVRRLPSRGIDRQLGGKVWIDQVSLRAVEE
jgi:hypothetical protein